jgi:hypothetical protein
MKKTNWTQGTFDKVDWDTHGLAFHKLTRKCKISTAKLIHHLVNTNWQNNFYYGTSSFCPCCQRVDETLERVLLCSSPVMSNHHTSSISQLLAT